MREPFAGELPILDKVESRRTALGAREPNLPVRCLLVNHIRPNVGQLHGEDATRERNVGFTQRCGRVDDVLESFAQRL